MPGKKLSRRDVLIGSAALTLGVAETRVTAVRLAHHSCAPSEMRNETIGNGRATCIVLAREGARVVVADRDMRSAQDTVALVREEGGEAIACSFLLLQFRFGVGEARLESVALAAQVGNHGHGPLHALAQPGEDLRLFRSVHGCLFIVFFLHVVSATKVV